MMIAQPHLPDLKDQAKRFQAATGRNPLGGDVQLQGALIEGWPYLMAVWPDGVAWVYKLRHETVQ